MIGTLLVMLTLVGQSPSGPAKPSTARPEDLIARLGSPRFAEREAAAVALEKLGRLALPALVARRDHRDPEIRARANALIAKIEGTLLLEPTAVTLDFSNRPLAEVVASLARQTDLPLTLAPGQVVDRRLTLHSDGAVPFWSALDRLTEAAGLGYAAGSPYRGRGVDRSLVLSPGLTPPNGLVSDHGPFRVRLMSLHYQRDLAFSGRTATRMPGMVGQPGIPGPRPNVETTADGQAITELFSIRLQVVAEPRLSLRQTGAPKLLTAVDDQGQALQLPATPGTDPMPAVNVHFESAEQGAIPFQVGLKRGSPASRTIRLLRGSLPVSVSTRRPSPLVVHLDGAAGKTFRDEDASIAVHELRPMNPAAGAGPPYQLDLTIDARSPRTLAPPPQAPDLDAWMPRFELGPLQVEIVDGAGRLASWYMASSQPEGERVRVSLVVNTIQGEAPPSALRYYGVVRAQTEIPFEFRDVPMP